MKANLRIWGATAAAAALLTGLPGTIYAQDASTPPQATVATAATPVALPFGASEVVKMHQGGISKDVIMGYVANSTGPFRLSADQIIYLKSIGIPEDVVTAMIHREGEMQRNIVNTAVWQQQMAAQQAQAQAVASANAQAVVTPSTPAPAVDYGSSTAPPVVYPDYSDYDYGYPYYGSGYVGPYWGWGGWPYYYGGWGYRGGYGHGYGGYRGGVGFHGGFGGGFHGGVGGGFHGGGGGGFHGGGGGGAHGGGGGGHR